VIIYKQESLITAEKKSVSSVQSLKMPTC